MCTLNGRFDPLLDGFTSASSKGLAVVDYCLVPIQNFSAFSKFQVIDIHELVHSKNITVDSKIPDHRLLAWKVAFDNLVFDGDSRNPTQTTTKRIPQDYFEDPKVHEQLNSLAAQIDEEEGPRNIDGIYTQFCTLLDEQLVDRPIKPNRMHGKKNRAKP